MLEYWLYVSDALPRPRSVDDALVYLQSSNRNHAHGITGYLHREEGHYAQYLEGPPGVLRTLKHAIHKDGRHRNIRTLLVGTVRNRRFAGWDMAFSTTEMASFRLFQRTMNRPESLADAQPEDVLDFMKDTAARGRAIEPGRSSRASWAA